MCRTKEQRPRWKPRNSSRSRRVSCERASRRAFSSFALSIPARRIDQRSNLGLHGRLQCRPRLGEGSWFWVGFRFLASARRETLRKCLILKSSRFNMPGHPHPSSLVPSHADSSTYTNTTFLRQHGRWQEIENRPKTRTPVSRSVSRASRVGAAPCCTGEDETPETGHSVGDRPAELGQADGR